MTKNLFLAQNPFENGAEFFSERWTICFVKVRPKKKNWTNTQSAL